MHNYAILLTACLILASVTGNAGTIVGPTKPTRVNSSDFTPVGMPTSYAFTDKANNTYVEVFIWGKADGIVGLPIFRKYHLYQKIWKLDANGIPVDVPSSGQWEDLGSTAANNWKNAPNLSITISLLTSEHDHSRIKLRSPLPGSRIAISSFYPTPKVVLALPDVASTKHTVTVDYSKTSDVSNPDISWN